MAFLIGCFVCACGKEDSIVDESLVEDTKEVSSTEKTKSAEEEAAEQWEKGYGLPVDEQEEKEAENDCRAMMEHIYEIYEQYFMTEEEECLVQQESMNEEEREYFLNRFRGNEDCDLQSLIGMEIEEEEEQTLIGFCVLGGIFGEGIDLKKDSLIGVIVVGTGLPQVGCEREILKDYFDDNGENGFDYSYRYPGMNKVLQAAGRVIRTAEDVGIIVLLDERFRQYSYRRMFPREWEQVVPVTVDTVAKKVERFWDAWLWQQR